MIPMNTRIIGSLAMKNFKSILIFSSYATTCNKLCGQIDKGSNYPIVGRSSSLMQFEIISLMNLPADIGTFCGVGL